MSESKTSYSDLPETYRSRDDFPEAYAAPNETLEVVRRSEEKEVARDREDDAPEAYQSTSPALDSAGQRASARKRRRRRWVYAIAILFLLFAVALGVGLGVGLSRSRTDKGSKTGAANGSNAGGGSGANTTNGSPGVSDPGASPQRILSTRAAFNGSDISVTHKARLCEGGSLEVEDDNSNILLFYQHYTGEIRWMQHLAPETCYGGTADQVIATDAKNGTSMDMISKVDSMLELHVYYIGSDNRLKERWRGVNSVDWQDGLLTSIKYHVLDAPQVALRVGQYNVPIANSTTGDVQACVKLFVGAAETTINELSWCSGEDWQLKQTWPNVNGRATPAYMGWTYDLITYVAFIDTEDAAQLYWLSIGNTATQALNQWALVPSASIPNVDPSAVLSALANGSLTYRSAGNGSIANSDVTLSMGQSTASLGWSWDSQMLPDSQLEIMVTQLNGQEVYLFYQAKGDDITMATGSMAHGPTTTVAWPVPD